MAHVPRVPLAGTAVLPPLCCRVLATGDPCRGPWFLVKRAQVCWLSLGLPLPYRLRLCPQTTFSDLSRPGTPGFPLHLDAQSNPTVTATPTRALQEPDLSQGTLSSENTVPIPHLPQSATPKATPRLTLLPLAELRAPPPFSRATFTVPTARPPAPNLPPHRGPKGSRSHR